MGRSSSRSSSHRDGNDNRVDRSRTASISSGSRSMAPMRPRHEWLGCGEGHRTAARGPRTVVGGVSRWKSRWRCTTPGVANVGGEAASSCSRGHPHSDIRSRCREPPNEPRHLGDPKPDGILRAVERPGRRLELRAPSRRRWRVAPRFPRPRCCRAAGSGRRPAARRAAEARF